MNTHPSEGAPPSPDRRNLLKIVIGAGVVGVVGTQIARLLGMGKLDFTQAHKLTVWAGEEQSRVTAAWADLKTSKPQRSREEVEAMQQAYEDALQKIADSDYPWMLLNMVRTGQLSDTGKTRHYIGLAARRFRESINQGRTPQEQGYVEQEIVAKLCQVHRISAGDARTILSQLIQLANARQGTAPRSSQPQSFIP